MHGKVQRNQQGRSLMMMRGPIVRQSCVGRYRETNKEDPWWWWEDLLYASHVWEDTEKPTRKIHDDDERTYCKPVMCGKIQRNQQGRSLMMMRGPIVSQSCVGRYRETNKEDPWWWWEDLLYARHAWEDTEKPTRKILDDDERTYCTPVMCGKIQRNQQGRSMMMMRGPIVSQSCVGRYRETNKEDPWWWWEDLL